MRQIKRNQVTEGSPEIPGVQEGSGETVPASDVAHGGTGADFATGFRHLATIGLSLGGDGFVAEGLVVWPAALQARELVSVQARRQLLDKIPERRGGLLEVWCFGELERGAGVFYRVLPRVFQMNQHPLGMTPQSGREFALLNFLLEPLRSGPGVRRRVRRRVRGRVRACSGGRFRVRFDASVIQRISIASGGRKDDGRQIGNRRARPAQKRDMTEIRLAQPRIGETVGVEHRDTRPAKTPRFEIRHKVWGQKLEGGFHFGPLAPQFPDPAEGGAIVFGVPACDRSRCQHRVIIGDESVYEVSAVDGRLAGALCPSSVGEDLQFEGLGWRGGLGGQGIGQGIGLPVGLVGLGVGPQRLNRRMHSEGAFQRVGCQIRSG